MTRCQHRLADPRDPNPPLVHNGRVRTAVLDKVHLGPIGAESKAVVASRSKSERRRRAVSRLPHAPTRLAGNTDVVVVSETLANASGCANGLRDLCAKDNHARNGYGAVAGASYWARTYTAATEIAACTASKGASAAVGEHCKNRAVGVV